MHLDSTYVKLVIVRKIVSFLCLTIAAIGCAQFKVDPQKIPVVQRKRRALIIGASNYQHLGKLSFASSDAERFRDALISGFGFSKDSIQFVSDSPDSPAKPVAATILSELDKMLKDPILDRGDMFILYFSGHGMATTKGDYLCSTDTKPSDVETTGVPVLEVVQKLVKAKLRNVVIIADACRAGEKNEFGSELFDEARKANIAVMLGCSPGQKSYEVPLLKSGAFTYFLLKALSNPKNRTESGGLWTSKVAQSVENSVFEYTQHEYGDSAQRPRSFADPTSDVLLAKFISKPNQRSLTKENEDLAMVSDPEKISDEMLEIGINLSGDQNYAESLEACKQAISLNSQNMYAAYYASISTASLGRSGEHEKFCNILRQSNEPFFHNLGLVQSDSRATPISDRLQALKAFWDSSPQTELYAMIAWAKARTFCPLGLTKELIKHILPDLKGGTRAKPFFEAETAVADNLLETGLAKYRECLKIKEGSSLITDDELTVLQFPILRQLRRDEELKTLMRAQFNSEHVSQVIWVPVAANLKQMGNRDAAIKIVKKGMKEPNLTEQTVVLSAQIMGAAIGDIADELEAAQKESPYSWKIRVAALISRGLKAQDAEATTKAYEEAAKYCDDDLEIISLTYTIESAIFDDATKYLGVPAEKFAEAKELFRLMYFNRAQLIGTDSEKWYQLGELGLDTLQGPNTLRLFKKHVADFNASSELGSEFYTMLFQLAASVENDELAKFAANHPAMTEPDRTDVQLLHAAYLVSRGDYASARNVFDKVGEVSEANKVVKESLTMILKARTGDLSGLTKFVKQKFTDTEGNLIAQGIAALALYDLKQYELAQPLLQIFTSRQPVMIPSVPLRCVERYLKLLKSKGKTDEADQSLFELLKINQSSPAVMTSYFGLKPGISEYVGHLSAETKWISDQAFDPKNPSHKDTYETAAIGQGKFELTIDKSGVAKGSIEVLDGETFELSGTVDQFGNLRGKAKSKRHEYDVEAKLIGNEFKKSEAFKKSSIGQMVNMFDENGLAIHWMLPASVLKTLRVTAG